MRRNLSENEKKFICEMVKNQLDLGQSLDDIFENIKIVMGIYSSQIYSWNKKFGMIFKNNLFSEDEKIDICERVVERILFGEVLSTAVKDVAYNFGIDKHAIYNWNKSFKIFKTSKKFSIEDKKNICHDVLNLVDNGFDNGSAVRIVAKDNNVSMKSIYTWNREFNIFQTFGDGRQTVYSDSFKRNVLNDISFLGVNTTNIKNVALKYNISVSTIYSWNQSLKVFNTKFLNFHNDNTL